MADHVMLLGVVDEQQMTNGHPSWVAVSAWPFPFDEVSLGTSFDLALNTTRSTGGRPAMERAPSTKSTTRADVSARVEGN